MRDLYAPLGVALVLRFALLLLVPAEPSWDGVIYARAAEQLARGEGYTLRILAEGNAPVPTAFYPVGFPAVLSVVRALGGGLWADRLLQIIATTLLVPLSYLFARRVKGRGAGKSAAYLAAVWPGGLLLSASWLAEPVFALGLGVALVPLLYARRKKRLRALVIAGLGLGVIAYVRPSALPIAALLGLAFGISWSRSSIAARAAYGLLGAAAMTAVACIPLAPWIVRNQRLLGEPVLVSTNGGVNLLIGTIGDGSFASIDPNDPCKRAALREPARDRCYGERARRLILADPFASIGRALVKLAHTFGHESAPAQCFADGARVRPGARETLRLWSLGICRVAWMILLSLALSGARQVSAAGTPGVVLFAPIAALAALHMVYLGGDRYHAAVAPMFIALAAVALVGRKRRERRAESAHFPARLDG